MGESPEPLEVAGLAIPGDKNSYLVVFNLPFGPPEELAPDTCDAVGVDNQWVLQLEVVLLHSLWTPLDVALGIDVFVE